MRSIFLALTVTTAYALLRGWPAELHPVLRACFAVLVLVLGIGLWRKRERPACSQARAIRPPRWPDYLAVGLGVLAIECLFLFFLTAVPPHAGQLARKVEELVAPEQAAAGLAPSGPAPGGSQGNLISGNWLWDDEGKRTLPLSTKARPSNKPEVFFRPASREVAGHLLRRRPYIRAFALERYKDAAWLPIDRDAESLEADPTGWVTLGEPATRPGPVLRGEMFHPAHPDGQDVLTAPQGATEVRLPKLRRIDPGILRLNPLRDPDAGYEYEVIAKTVTLDALIEGGLLNGFRLPDDIPPHLVETTDDEELQQALIDIAVKTQGPLEARLLALRKVLQGDFSYSLEVENPDRLDPITNFLLHEQRGHCEFFATAGALLCRTLNIPARIAYGWTGGRYYQSQNLFMFRAREAHAWTEIYLKDVGWVIFDPTPPGAIDAASSSIAPPDEAPPLNEDGKLEFPTHGPDREETRLWTFVALGAGLGLLPLAFFVLRFRRQPTTIAGATPCSLLPHAPGYLDRFRQACRTRGNPMPSGRTLRQHLATFAQDHAPPTFAQDLLEYHYAVTYGGAKPNRVREAKLLKSIKRWS